MYLRLNFLRRFSAHWPFALVGAAPLVVFSPIVFGGRVMFWGLPLLQFYPWRYLSRQAILSGRLPLWNDLLGSGAPLLANYQSAAFYPPNWLDFLLPLDYSIGLVTVLHFVWAGLGLVALARALGLGSFGRTIAGLAFSLSTYFVARLSFISIISSAAWLPWMVWATELGIRELGIRRLGVGGFRYLWVLIMCATMQLLAGHAQTTFYSWLLVAAWAMARLATAARSAQPTARRLPFATRHLLLAVSPALAAILAAVQLLPTFELMRTSQRATGAEYEFAATYSLWPWRLITFFAPSFFGQPANADYWGYGNYWEDAAYVGLLPLGLALMAGVAWLTRRRKSQGNALATALRSPFGQPQGSAQARDGQPGQADVLGLVPFLVGVAAFSILLALGRNTPVFPFLYRHVPPFNLFQAPARMLIGFVFAVSLLAGIGADVWRAPRGSALYWTRLGVAGAIAMALAAAIASQALTVEATFLGATVGLGLWAAGAFTLSLLKPGEAPGERPVRAGWWQAAAVGFVALDLVVTGYRLNPYATSSVYRAATNSGAFLRAYLDGQRLYQFAGDEYEARFKRWFRFEAFGPGEADYWLGVREAQLSNLNVLDDLASADNFDPLIPARYATLLDALEAAPPDVAAHGLRAMDVSAVASSRPIADWPAVYSGDGWAIYGVPGQSQRVRVVYSARHVSDAADALAALLDPDFDPEAEVILESDSAEPGLTPAVRISQFVDYAVHLLPPAPRASHPTLISLTNSGEVVTIHAALERRGWVVLSDTYYPGWRAFLDGEAAPVLHANYAFRAVAVPAGAHVVEFRYQPRSLRIGAVTSGLGWLAMIGLGVLLRRQRL